MGTSLSGKGSRRAGAEQKSLSQWPQARDGLHGPQNSLRLIDGNRLISSYKCLQRSGEALVN